MAGVATRPDPPALRVVVRPIGSPLPLALLALCSATIGVAAVQLRWIPVAEGGTVGLLLLVFAAPLQLLSAVYGFLARDPAAGTGMAVLAGTWAGAGVVWHAEGAAKPSPALGIFLVMAAAAVVVPAVASLPGKVLVSGVLLLAAARLAVTGVYELGASRSVETAAGWLGVALGAVGWYAAMALEVESAGHRTVLPTLRFGPGRTALSGTLAQEEEVVHHEAGVRRQL